MGGITDQFYQRHLPHYQPEDATYFVTFRLNGSLPWGVIEQLRFERLLFEKTIANATNMDTRKERSRVRARQYFEKFDALLDGQKGGPMWLRRSDVAEIVANALMLRDGREYELLAYCIMPNHVHLVIEVGRTSVRPQGRAEARPTRLQRDVYELTRILRLIKGSTARQCNLILNRQGQFWQHESYDHVIRDDGELEGIISYVAFNPVLARLTDSWEQWRSTYVKD